VEEGLRKVFFYAFQNPANHAHRFAAPNLTFKRIAPGTEFELLGQTIMPFRLMHGKLPILGYRLNNVAFCTDVSTIPSDSEQYLQGLDTLIIDALRPEPHPTHMHLDLALKTIKRLQPRKAILTHLSHSFDHQQLADSLPPNVEPAFDGMRIPLNATT
jgi:phosphoribosyl 1,2-cyclic phosphate phosphodiesterase